MLDLPLYKHQIPKDLNISPAQITLNTLQYLHDFYGIQIPFSQKYSGIEQLYSINDIQFLPFLGE